MNIRTPEPSSAARILVRELAELGLDLKYTQALHIFAKALGFQNLHALQASQTSGGNQTVTEVTAADHVTVAVYEHKHGSDICVFSTEAGADAWRTTLAKEWWDDSFPDEEAPSDATIGEEYFDRMSDQAYGEWFNVHVGLPVQR